MGSAHFFQRGNQIDEHTTTDFALAWLGDVMVELIQPFGMGTASMK